MRAAFESAADKTPDPKAAGAPTPQDEMAGASTPQPNQPQAQQDQEEYRNLWNTVHNKAGKHKNKSRAPQAQQQNNGKSKERAIEITEDTDKDVSVEQPDEHAAIADITGQQQQVTTEDMTWAKKLLKLRNELNAEQATAAEACRPEVQAATELEVEADKWDSTTQAPTAVGGTLIETPSSGNCQFRALVEALLQNSFSNTPDTARLVLTTSLVKRVIQAAVLLGFREEFAAST